MRKIVFLVFILAANLLFSDHHFAEVDSLENLLPELKGKEKMKTLNILAVEYIEYDPQRSIDYGNQALAIAEKLELIDYQSNILSTIGVAYEIRGNYSKAIELYEESLKLAEQLDDKKIIANTMVNLSTANQNMGSHDVALNYCLKALDIYEDLDFKEGIAKTLNNIGNVYLYLQQYEKALQYYLQSMALKQELDNSADLASSYHNIALVYQELEDYQKARQYYDQALDILNKNHDDYGIAVCYTNMASLYFIQEDYDKSLFYDNEALVINKSIENKDGICLNLNNIANTLIQQNKYTQVPDFLEESLTIAREYKNRDMIADNYGAYADFYEQTNKPDIALSYFKKSKALKDSINDAMNKQVIAELGIQYETTKREKELELLKVGAIHHNQVRNYLIYGLVFGLAVVIFLLNLYYEKIKDGKIRQEIQEKLQESEILYRTLTDNLKSAVYTFNPEGKMTYVNKATCQITGYSEEELLKMRFFDFIHPQFRDYISQRGLSLIQGENVVPNYELKIITKEGKEKWIETSSTRVTISNNIMVLGTAIDVTERHLAIEKLQASEAHLRALFAGMEEVIFVMDKNGKYISIAPTNPDLLYKPASELIGKKLNEIFEAEISGFFLDKITLCLSAQEMVSFDYQLDINGVAYWFGGCVTPLSQDTVLFIGRDITDEKISMQKLIESEEKYRNLVEAIEEGMTIVDKDMNFVFVNNAACKIYGYSKQEMLKMNVLDIVPAEYRELISAQHKIRLHGESTTYENWNKRKDGELRLMKISASPLKLENGAVNTISLFSDVTEMREAEEKIKASLREKEVLLQEVYHRVKNNMQIISSMLKLQSRYINKENAIEVFKNSQNRVKSMSLIHEKLYRSNDLSRIDINDYLESLLKQLFISYHANLHGIIYQVECENINLNINTAIPCGLIVNELVTNAMKHAFRNREDGIIFIKLQKIPNELFRLEVGNNGSDFSPEFKLENAPSFGLQLVDILRSQLHAEFRLDHTNGVNFIFIFKELIK
ncbi:MAG: PAS domain S-box protein [Candidatus Cloacimonadales bacterium]|nr:PAS domain S-box protein [Candidatus Cloacimonadales bacterium]